MKNIALLTGWTKEREISLQSAKNIQIHLSKTYKVDMFILPEDINKFIKEYDNYDLIIPVSHGKYIEDGKIIALLEILNKPFLFSGSEAHNICMNKYLTSIIAQDLWFIIPQHCLIQNIDDIKTCKIKGRIFIKPNHWGSSIDMGVFDNLTEANKLIKTILKYDDVIVQQAIKGREFTVSVIGDYNKEVTAIAVTEIITSRDFFDFKAKYERAETEEITPAKIDKKMQMTLENISVTLYKKLKLKTMGRIDFIYNKGKFHFIEINTIPGMTEKSLVPQALLHHGYESLGEFLEESIRNM